MLSHYPRVLILHTCLSQIEDESNFDLSGSLYNITRNFKKVFCNDADDPKLIGYVWGKETDSEKGIHYHINWFIPEIPDTPRIQGKTRIQGLEKRAFEVIRNYFSKNKKGRSAIPFKCGSHIVDREYLNITKQEAQRQEIQSLIDSRIPTHKYNDLSLNKIRKRNNNKAVAVGGVLTECLYTISYTIKHRSKVLSGRRYGTSNIKPSNDVLTSNSDLLELLERFSTDKQFYTR